MQTKLLRIGVVLTLVGLALAALALWLGFTWAPDIKGDDWKAPEAYRILFWHVPSAWASFLAFTILFIGSTAWFLGRVEWGWRLHVVGAELGLLYGLCVITSGPIWGAAEWGVPWDLTDVRLNTFALLAALALFLVQGHRTQAQGEDMRDTFATVGMFGFLLVPLTYMATRFWEKRHPGPVVATGEGTGTTLDPAILQVLLLSALAFQILVIGHAMLSWAAADLEVRLNRAQMELDARM